MSTLDSLNIDPGYAIIYHIVVDYKYLSVKSLLEENGFTVISRLPPCEKFNGTAFIRRINILTFGEMPMHISDGLIIALQTELFKISAMLLLTWLIFKRATFISLPIWHRQNRVENS